MKDRLSNKPGRILITPEDGSKPFYAIVTRADEPLQEGDALSKANLLKDQTAARYGKGNNAVPDTIFDQIAEELDRYSFAQASGVKIERGSYVGDGTAGADSKNQIELDMDPMVVFIAGEDATDWGLLLNPSPFGLYMSEIIQDTLRAEWNEGMVSWHSDYFDSATPSESAHRQLNDDGATYHYVALGLGNTGLDFDRLDYMTLLGDDDEEVDA